MNITCPHCTENFLLIDAIGKEKMDDFKKEISEKQKIEIEKEKEILREQMNSYKAKVEEDAKIANAKMKTEIENAEKLFIQKINAENESKLKFLESQNLLQEEKIKQAKQKELELLELQNQLKEIKENTEHEKQKALLEGEAKFKEKYDKEVLGKLKENYETKIALMEKEKLLQDESQKKTIEELKQKIVQGSMQTQGEAQELLLEELLDKGFPTDLLNEVPKGKRGADCLLTVRNQHLQDCGKIIFESKRTKAFEKDWIEKLKTDMRNANADIAILVTAVMPKDTTSFKQIDGIWICTFSEVLGLTSVIREGIIKVFASIGNQINKGDKMNMLYNYLTSNEFSEQWNAIREGFLNMKMSIARERDAMEKLWKAREKQLEKILINASGIKGNMEGITGQDNIDFNLIGEAENLELE